MGLRSDKKNRPSIRTKKPTKKIGKEKKKKQKVDVVKLAQTIPEIKQPAYKPKLVSEFNEVSKILDEKNPPKKKTEKRKEQTKPDTLKPKKKKKKRNKKKIKKFLITIAICIVACLGIGGFICLYNSDAFKIQNIKFNGVEHLTEEEMLKLANVSTDDTLMRVDTDTIKTRLKLDSWIEDVDIVRVFPDTLEINVKERTITGIVEVPTSSQDSKTTTQGSTVTQGTVRNWAISKDHLWLMPVPDQNSEAGKSINQQIYEDIKDVIHVVDVSPSLQPEIGKFCTDDNVNCAIDVVASMTTDLKNQVQNVKASDPNSTTLVLKNGVEISLGNSDNIREKERVCLELLNSHEGKISYINVRNPNSPTWRSI